MDVDFRRGRGTDHQEKTTGRRQEPTVNSTHIFGNRTPVTLVEVLLLFPRSPCSPGIKGGSDIVMEISGNSLIDKGA